ncbi:hypothetical protein [Bacillus sp. 165]|uniref:hypothetical protein n=1 Tax=Bacillus sp. 165 TaxID=1529117 RepID=UPI001ADC2EBB|nr:hypothetical protein [Bacillus sp. 165]MBO9129723.1 hypothetical protein [Bacillus sp. 165]
MDKTGSRLQDLYRDLKDTLTTKNFSMQYEHTVEPKEVIKSFVGSTYCPFDKGRQIYQVEVHYNALENSVKVQTTGLTESLLVYSVKKERQGILFLVYYFDVLDHDFIEALLQYILDSDEKVDEMLRGLNEKERNETVRQLKDLLLSNDLPVMDLPSLVIEDIFQKVGLL